MEQPKMSGLFIFPPLLIPNDPNGWIPLCQGRAELSTGVKLGGKDLPEHRSGTNAEYIYISLAISGVLPILDNLTFSLLNSILHLNGCWCKSKALVPGSTKTSPEEV